MPASIVTSRRTRPDRMTQSLLDMTDLVIVGSFITATITLIVYVWRAEHRPRHNYDIVDFR